jgi:PAS domain S-box-containing protein
MQGTLKEPPGMPFELLALQDMQSALDAAGIVVWDLELATDRVSRSGASLAVLGIPTETGGSDFARRVHPEDRARIDAALTAAYRGERPYDIEFRLVRPDGEVRWLHEAAIVHRDPAGRPVRISGVTLDITQQRRATAALDRERELLQGIIDGIPVMLTLYEPDTHVLRLNREFERIVGWTSEDVRSIDLMEACYPDPLVREAAREFMQSVTPGWRDFPLTTKGGRTIETSWANIRLSDGRQVGIGIDLHERRAAETALRESEDRYRRVVEISLEAMWVHCDGKIVFANRRAAQVFGADSPDALVGRPVFELCYPEDRAKAIERTRTMLESGEPAPLAEMRYMHPSGTTVPLEVQAVPFQYEGRPAVLAVGRDVSERKAAEERQSLLMAELDHRVRNILASVQAMIVLTGHNVATKEAYAAALKGRISAMAQAHGLLTRRRWQGVDLIDIVGVVKQAYPEAVSLAGDAGCILRAKDALNLALVLHELATNAAKHGALSMPTGRVNLSWRVKGRAPSARLHFVWAEQGGPPVALPAQTGFGLQLIRGALPNAALRFEPSGVHCELTLKLASPDPSRATATPAVAAQPPQNRSATGSLSGLRVLLVEDDPLTALDLRLTLEEAGADIAGVAATLEEAMSLIDGPLSAAVLDVNLGGEMVYPAAERLVARGVPVVLATGYDARTVIPEPLRSLPTLQKPLEPGRVVECLAGLLLRQHDG